MINGTWIATHDHMPGADLRLTVRGTCTCPSAGYTLGLSRAKENGGEKDLVLAFEAVPPGSENEVDQIETACSVELVVDNAPEFDTVTIQGEGGSTVEVSHVH